MKTIFLLAAPAVVLAAPVVAQDPDTIDNRPTDAIVVTASGVEQAADTTGQAVTVIDRATIDQRQTVALSDLLETTPGVTVSRNGGIGTVTSVRIRGAEGEQTLTLIDGVRVNDPSSPGGAFDFANLLSSSIERVEVLRGPDSVPWGSQAIGGVVNVITEQPTDTLRARANVEYGDMDTVFASGGVSGGKGIVSGALTGGYLRTDGVSAYAGGTEPDGYRQYGATGRAVIAFAPNLRLDLRGYWADSRTDIDGFPPPTFSFADTREYSKTREIYAYAGLHADFLGGRLRNTIAFQIADIDRDTYDPDASPTLEFFFRGKSERYTYKGDFRVTDWLRLVAGAEHEKTSLYDGTDRFDRGVTSEWGEAIATPIDHLTVTGGVRHDDDDAFGGKTTFGANAAYALLTGTTLRASYAEGFKAPTLYQLYAPFYGTPGLRPETAKSYDIGIAQRLAGDRLVASATWFRRSTRNQIDFDPVTSTYSNIDRARAYGVELSLIARPVDRLTVVWSYSYINTKNLGVDDHGDDLARRPRNTASVAADYRFPFGLSVGATVLDVSKSFDDAANSVPLKGYTLTDLRGEIPLGDRFSLYGRVTNLFDVHYQTVANYGTLGRAFYGGIRVKFD